MQSTRTIRRTRLAALAAVAALTFTACGNDEDGAAPDPGTTGAETGAPADDADLTESDTLTVVSHSSFSLPEELLAQFEEESGYSVTYSAPGDAGALVNQLVLTKDSPLGDVVFGIDNTFASRANDAGVLAPYESDAASGVPAELAAPNLTAIDLGDVCINADKTWFEENDLEIPQTLDDLTDEQYRDLLVVPSPASSSPGLSFLLATIGAKGEDWTEYWQALSDNGLLVVSGWTEAYYTEFSGADGEGPRPLVLSYSTSPAFTVDGDESTTTALLDTCFRQVEYAGVISGAQNEVGARAFIDFLLREEVQAAIPENMYMYPAVADTELPPEWAQHAPLADNPIEVSQDEIGENRDAWIREWTAVTS